MDVREKLVELLNKANSACVGTDCFEGCKFYMENDCLYKLMADVMIENGVTAQEWISVDERLPENDVMVIGYTPCDGFMFVGYYNEEPKYDWKVWRIVTAMRSTKVMKKKVTHWLPLPQPPKGE